MVTLRGIGTRGSDFFHRVFLFLAEPSVVAKQVHQLAQYRRPDAVFIPECPCGTHPFVSDPLVSDHSFLPDSFAADPLGCPQGCRSDYDEAVAYLYGRIDYERAAGPRNNHLFRLERTEELFQALGLGGYLHRRRTGTEVRQPETATPEKTQPIDGDRLRIGAVPKVPLVHIAGTKGKGSTATMVSGILTAAGYRVGLYTSPHLTDLEERFRIDGVPCSRDSLVELVKFISPVVDRFDAGGRPVSFFELTTAMAVLHFDRNNCDAIVLEVGLGGRLDSTNVCASSVAAVTSIGLDHQRVLGSTIEEIAAEKAGIIKGGVPVVSGVTRSGAAAVIRQAARQRGSRFYEVAADFETRDRRDAAVGSEFVYHCSAAELSGGTLPDRLPVYLALDGSHQVQNAAIAISIVRLLSSPTFARPFAVSDDHIREGLRNIRCVGRIERFVMPNPADGSSPIQLIIDTSHNQDSIAALCDSIKRRVVDDVFPVFGRAATQDAPAGLIRRPVVVVFGTSRDKDVAAMSAELSAIADQIICTRYTTNPRSVPVSQLIDAFKRHASGGSELTIQKQPDPCSALRQALQEAAGGTVVVCGSFFLAGELRPQVLALPGLRPLVDPHSEGRQSDDGQCEPRRDRACNPLASIDTSCVETAVDAREADVP